MALIAEKIDDDNDDITYQNFLNDFSDFNAEFNDDNETNKIDEEWINKFFGRRPSNVHRKDITYHLEEKFLKHCELKDPFEKFKIDDSSILDTINERFICEKCNHSRLYYCYSCYVISERLKNNIPYIKLPINIDIIKHPQELSGKSTSTHAKIIAPDNVRIFIYPDMPIYDWNDSDKILLLFPKANSLNIKQYLNNYYHEEYNDEKILSSSDKNDDDDDHGNNVKDSIFEFPIKTIVVIDSTWQQTKKILRDVHLQRLKSIIIDTKQTMFWRYQHGRGITINHLSTIEAIYYLLVEIHEYMNALYEKINNDDKNLYEIDEMYRKKYDGQYDNLLYFFKHTFNLIKNCYDL